MQNTAFYSYLNTGAVPQPDRVGKTYAMLNTGVISQILPHNVAYSYLNLGLPTPEQRTVTRGPRGWGILPVDKKEFTVFTDESKGKTYAYIYTITP